MKLSVIKDWFLSFTLLVISLFIILAGLFAMLVMVITVDLYLKKEQCFRQATMYQTHYEFKVDKVDQCYLLDKSNNSYKPLEEYKNLYRIVPIKNN